jgi:hypothetical protein
VIVCTNWRNPITPGVVSGFYIRTLDEHGDLMDKSISLDLDASGLLPDVILDEHLSLELSVPATGQVSSYTISFEIDIPMETTGECFVKYMFPVELDLTGLDIEDIEGYGMFIDETGSIITFDKDNL